MDAETRPRSQLVRIALTVTIATVVPCGGAEAQTNQRTSYPGGVGTNRTDVYGNVRPGLPDRRPMGIFRNDAEREALGSYQTLGRRQDRRGGTIAFSLPGDLLDLTTLSVLANTAVPTVMSAITPAKRMAFAQYGGFGQRRPLTGATETAGALSRRYALIAATSTNAPVYRAMTQRGTLAAMRLAIVRTPFIPTDAEDPSTPTTSLYERLNSGLEATHARARQEAWISFREGEYRRAARGFEAATMLESNDLEARIGEIFCHISIGALQTTVVLQQTLNRRADPKNPFVLDLDLAQRYGDPGTAQQLRINAGLQAEAVDVGRHPHRTATFILILWYLGSHDDAIRAATTLARAPTAKAYADWPAKMRVASSQVPPVSPHP